VPASLVRVSIGLEDAVWLYKMFADTSKAAKARNDRGGVNNRPLTSLRRSAINAHPTSNCSVLVVLAPSDWVCTAGKSKEGWLVRCVAVTLEDQGMYFVFGPSPTDVDGGRNLSG
jgi:hypothetical protein